MVSVTRPFRLLFLVVSGKSCASLRKCGARIARGDPVTLASSPPREFDPDLVPEIKCFHGDGWIATLSRLSGPRNAPKLDCLSQFDSCGWRILDDGRAH